MNEYTLKIKQKGWTVVDALKRWNVSRDSFDRWRACDRYQKRLNDLIDGLEDRNEKT